MESSGYGLLNNKDHDGSRRRRRRKRDPKNEKKWEDLKKFVWNTKTKEILGRDFRSWGQLFGPFYIPSKDPPISRYELFLLA